MEREHGHPKNEKYEHILLNLLKRLKAVMAESSNLGMDRNGTLRWKPPPCEE
jgi:hypothetical protein